MAPIPTRPFALSLMDLQMISGEPAVSSDDGIASVSVIEAAYAALDRHDWISVRELADGDSDSDEQVA